MAYGFNILLASVLGVMRLMGFKSQAYQAICHIYIGGMISTYFFTRGLFWFFLILVMSSLELGYFLYFRIRGGPSEFITRHKL